MANIILSEKQLAFIAEQVKSNNKEIITEAEWYNLVGDIAGIFDPTGVVDVINGISYFSQGDQLFGLLSIISAVPYAGDVVAKPVMYALKVGKPSAKALNGVMKLSKAGKSVEAGTELAKLSASGGLIGWFTTQMGKLAPKLEQLINAMPGGVLKGFKSNAKLEQKIE